MRCASAWSPAGLSGIFETHIVEDPLLTGARGAGLALKKGVTVTACESEQQGVKISISDGGKIIPTVSTVAKKLLSMFPGQLGVEINVDVSVPIGGGLGTSGASALATALALGRLLGLRLSYLDLAKIAHVAEVECKTGLGTVSGLVVGGVVIVVRPGAPGNDLVDRLLFDKDMKAIIGFFGSRSKPEILSSARLPLIDAVGKRLIDELIHERSLEKLLEVSKRFSLETGLATESVKRAFKALEEAGIPYAGQTQIGDAVFTVVRDEQVDRAVGVLDNLKAKTIVSEISWEPARLV
jgi:pantoate kinase